jgi:hypothetical protein
MTEYLDSGLGVRSREAGGELGEGCAVMFCQSCWFSMVALFG